LRHDVDVAGTSVFWTLAYLANLDLSVDLNWPTTPDVPIDNSGKILACVACHNTYGAKFVESVMN
jgi:hypothetical protein